MLTERGRDLLCEGVAPVWSHPEPSGGYCEFCRASTVAWYVVPSEDDDTGCFAMCSQCAAECGAEGAP